jgi:hypothetical protein
MKCNPKQYKAGEMQPSNPYSARRRIRSIAGSRMRGKREAQIEGVLRSLLVNEA